MSLYVSVDPGTNNTAVVVWLNGKVHDRVTFKPPKIMSFDQKLIFIHKRFNDYLDDLTGYQANKIDAIAVEDFEKFTRNPYLKMSKCNQIAGMLKGVALFWCTKLMCVSKGRIKKTETAALAKRLIVNHNKWNEHELDAWQIGLIAGFGDART